MKGFESDIARKHFEENKPEALDIIVVDMLGDEPLRVIDVTQRLEEEGIPGYDPDDIQTCLNKMVDLYEAYEVRAGYVTFTDELSMEAQAVAYHQPCRKPNFKSLKFANPRLRTYIENGFDTKVDHATPFPRGTKLFVRTYSHSTSKYWSSFYNHIYAFQYKDGPVTPVDMWFCGRSTY